MPTSIILATDVAIIANLSMEKIEWFWAQTQRNPEHDCLEWTRAISGMGYPQVWLGGKLLGAHRVACSLSHGPMRAGQVVRHLCANPLCIAPEHIRAGSHAENMADRLVGGGLHRSPPGFPLTPGETQAVAEMHAAGFTQTELVPTIAKARVMIR
jgi:hypothetical protein